MTHVSVFYILMGTLFHYLAQTQGDSNSPDVTNISKHNPISQTTNAQHFQPNYLNKEQQLNELLSSVTKLSSQVETLEIAMAGFQNLATKVAALETTVTQVNKLERAEYSLENKCAKIETLNKSLEMATNKVDGMAKFVQYSHAFKPSVDGIIISYGSGFVTKALNPNGPQRTIKADENFAVQHVAFDWNTRKVYFASTDDGIKRSNLDGTNIERLIPESGHALALDSLTGNFYYGNNQPGSTINVCDRNGRYCSVIAQEQSNLYDIALHPSKRLIFWSNGSSIVRANIDGTDVRIIIQQSASAIGVDDSTDQLYWGQSGNLIASRDLNGKDPTVLRTGISSLDGIAVHGETVYYTNDKHGASVHSVSNDGSNDSVVPVSLLKSGRHVTFYGKKLSNSVQENPCEGSPCAHVCVAKLGLHVCLCPQGMKLEESSGNCT